MMAGIPMSNIQFAIFISILVGFITLNGLVVHWLKTNVTITTKRHPVLPSNIHDGYYKFLSVVISPLAARRYGDARWDGGCNRFESFLCGLGLVEVFNIVFTTTGNAAFGVRVKYYFTYTFKDTEKVVARLATDLSKVGNMLPADHYYEGMYSFYCGHTCVRPGDFIHAAKGGSRFNKKA